MAIASHNQRYLPLFETIVEWIGHKRVHQLRAFFSLRDYSTWIRVKHKKYWSLINLGDLYAEISTNLLDPLYWKRGVAIQDQDNCREHRRDNLFCCVEYHRSRIRRAAAKDFESAVKEFRADFQRAAPGAAFPNWIIDGSDPLAGEIARLEEKNREFQERIRQTVLDTPVKLLNGDEVYENLEAWEKCITDEKRDIMKASTKILSPNSRRKYALGFCDSLLSMMKFARGKRGRRHQPFNVLVYRLIMLQTRWRLDKNRNYVFRKDGQHRLETDWRLIIFLLLDIHLHQQTFPELEQFLAPLKKEPAEKGLKKMQTWLLNIYKNFPALDGCPFERKIPEAGFRKLIVSGDGRLKAIRL